MLKARLQVQSFARVSRTTDSCRTLNALAPASRPTNRAIIFPLASSTRRCPNLTGYCSSVAGGMRGFVHAHVVIAANAAKVTDTSFCRLCHKLCTLCSLTYSTLIEWVAGSLEAGPRWLPRTHQQTQALDMQVPLQKRLSLL